MGALGPPASPQIPKPEEEGYLFTPSNACSVHQVRPGLQHDSRKSKQTSTFQHGWLVRTRDLPQAIFSSSATRSLHGGPHETHGTTARDHSPPSTGYRDHRPHRAVSTRYPVPVRLTAPGAQPPALLLSSHFLVHLSLPLLNYTFPPSPLSLSPPLRARPQWYCFLLCLSSVW